MSLTIPAEMGSGWTLIGNVKDDNRLYWATRQRDDGRTEVLCHNYANDDPWTIEVPTQKTPGSE